MKLKGIDGDPHKRWSMWFKEMSPFFGTPETGGAWLSSARVVRCWVKSRNERNPCPQ